MFSKRCQVHILSGQGKSTSQTTSGAGLPPLPLKKNVPPLLSERKQKKTTKLRGQTHWLPAPRRWGTRRDFLQILTLIWASPEDLAQPLHVVACATAGRGCTGPEGSLEELQLTPTRRKAQLQQHNRGLPLRWHSHRGWLYCRITLPSQLAALCWNTNIEINTLKCSKPQARHKQPSASSDEEPRPQVTPLEDNKKAASTQCLQAPPRPEAPPCEPWTPSVRLSVPRTQTCSTATVSDTKTSQLSTFQTKWTLPCWCNHWQAQLRLLWTEKNHLHSQTEAKSNFAIYPEKG